MSSLRMRWIVHCWRHLVLSLANGYLLPWQRFLDQNSMWHTLSFFRMNVCHTQQDIMDVNFLIQRTIYTGSQMKQNVIAKVRISLNLRTFFTEKFFSKGGVLQNRWTWTKGEWQGGIPRPLQWTAANTISTYSYSPRLSFILLSNWTAMR